MCELGLRFAEYLMCLPDFSGHYVWLRDKAHHMLKCCKVQMYAARWEQIVRRRCPEYAWLENSRTVSWLLPEGQWETFVVVLSRCCWTVHAEGTHIQQHACIAI
jgi:hypothetical protein